MTAAATSRSSPSSPSASRRASRKRIVMRFLRSPVEIHGDGRSRRSSSGATSSCARRRRACAPSDTGETERSREPGAALDRLPGRAHRGVPFDERRGLIPNEAGRVSTPTGPVPGQYVVGWIKRGPSGVIGTNKKDAQETVEALLEDVAEGRVPEAEATDDEASSAARRARCDHVEFAGWQAIDPPSGRGEPHGRPAGQDCGSRRCSRRRGQRDALLMAPHGRRPRRRLPDDRGRPAAPGRGRRREGRGRSPARGRRGTRSSRA